jgi:predicted esterase
VLLIGFSQGACLALEYAARHARRFGGIAGLSGGLIGPAGTPRDYAGSFDGTPVFLGCGDADPHIPRARVVESAGVFRRMGANVTARIYPRMEHGINQDELNVVRGMLMNAVSST